MGLAFLLGGEFQNRYPLPSSHLQTYAQTFCSTDCDVKRDIAYHDLEFIIWTSLSQSRHWKLLGWW
jgi:hypothetical protein